MRLFPGLAVGHLISALRALFATSRGDSVPLIVELLSLGACPASIVLLLRLAAAGSLAASGAALALSHEAGHARPALRAGLVAHSAISLLSGRCAAGDPSLSQLRAAQPPVLLHIMSLAMGAHDMAATHWHDTGPAAGLHPPASAPPSTVPTAVGGFAWLLDIDGTLVQTDDLYFEAFKQLLEPFGHVVDEAFYSENVHGRADADVFVRLMPPGTAPEELEAMSQRKDALFCELYRAHAAANGPPVIPGIGAALTLAREQGVRCIAVTNAPRGAAEACIASLRETIPAATIVADTIIIGAECARAKPHPDPYLEAMRLLDVQPGDCIVFEDSSSGVRAGVACGARAVVGMRSCMTDKELRSLGASTTVDDWTSVTLDFLEELATTPAASPAVASSSRSPGESRAAVHAANSLRSLPALSTIMLAAAMSAAPAKLADAALLCKGAEERLPAVALRAYAASLLPLGALLVAAQHEDSASLSATWHRGAAGALLGTCALQTMALRADGHALRRWARRSIMAPVVAAAAVGMRCATR